MAHIIKSLGRSCNGCTRCCEGWLTGEAFGFKFYPGRACKFLGKTGCNIYEQRPYSPCVTFTCYWKDDINIPDWMRPNLSNVIILKNYLEGYEYLRFIQSGGKVKEEVFKYAEQLSKGYYPKNVVVVTTEKLMVYSNDEKFKKLFETK